jgi:hypothetical protein
MNITQRLSLQDAESFQAEVVNQYLAGTNTTQFSMLLDFIQILNSHSTMCKFYVAIWQELQTSGNSETMEALVVWSLVSEIMDSTQFIGSILIARISITSRPRHSSRRSSSYTDYIQNGQTAEIRNLHQIYRMRYFFAQYIWALSSKELVDNIIKIFDAINALPYVADMCFAAEAVNRVFIK